MGVLLRLGREGRGKISLVKHCALVYNTID